MFVGVLATPALSKVKNSDPQTHYEQSQDSFLSIISEGENVYRLFEFITILISVSYSKVIFSFSQELKNDYLVFRIYVCFLFFLGENFIL